MLRPKITAAEIERRLDEIRRLADPAAAHAEADRLMQDTLRSIASWGDTESRTVAKAALLSTES